MRNLIFGGLLLVALLTTAKAELYPKTGVLVVTVQGVESSQGTVRGYLFRNKDSWLQYDHAAVSATAPAREGQTVLRFEKVPLNARYAVSVYQDENNNGTMDTRSLLPIPKEPVGASNHQGNSMPRYFECSFYFKTSPTDLTVKLRKI